MQNALKKNLPIWTAAKISAADNAHWPNVDEALPVHHVNYGSRETSIAKLSKNTYLIATFSQKNGYQKINHKKPGWHERQPSIAASNAVSTRPMVAIEADRTITLLIQIYRRNHN